VIVFVTVDVGLEIGVKVAEALAVSVTKGLKVGDGRGGGILAMIAVMIVPITPIMATIISPKFLSDNFFPGFLDCVSILPSRKRLLE
jgi:hypothetical protein